VVPAQELFERLVPLTPNCPAWRYLEQRGIPAETIAAHQEQLRYLAPGADGKIDNWPLG
jgi:hypothetical protein